MQHVRLHMVADSGGDMAKVTHLPAGQLMSIHLETEAAGSHGVVVEQTLSANSGAEATVPVYDDTLSAGDLDADLWDTTVAGPATITASGFTEGDTATVHLWIMEAVMERRRVYLVSDEGGNAEASFQTRGGILMVVTAYLAAEEGPVDVTLSIAPQTASIPAGSTPFDGSLGDADPATGMYQWVQPGLATVSVSSMNSGDLSTIREILILTARSVE